MPNSPSSTFTLTILLKEYAVCRLPPEASFPSWVSGEMLSITRTKDELSIVCQADGVPLDVRQEKGWRCLCVTGPLEFTLVGVIASLTNAIAAAHLGVFVLSTYDTDYILVKDVDLSRAIEALRAAGHTIKA